MRLVHGPGEGAPRFAVFILCIASVVSFFSCFNQPLEPVAPSWETNLTLPLLHRTYTLSELVRKDTSLLHVGPGGQIVYATSAQVAPTYIGDLIRVSLRDTTVRAKFGAFRVNVPPIDLPVQMPWLPQGVNIPIPDTTVTVENLQATIGSFQSATFKSGEITLTLRNNLPVPLEVLDQVRIVDSHGAYVGSFVFSPAVILPNGSQTATDTLVDGTTMDNVITVAGIRMHTSGSQTPVPIPNGTLFSAHVATNNLRVRSAVVATVPAQRLKDNDTTHVTVDDSTLIRELHIARGGLDLSFTNRVNLDILLKYRLSELLRWDGASYVPFEDSISLPAMGGGSQAVNLAGTRIVSQGQGLLRSMQIISSVILPNGSTVPVTVSDTDKILIDVTRTDTVVADSATGVLKPTWVNLNKVVPVRSGDLGSRFSGQFHIPEATLALMTNSTIDFPMDLNIRIGARRSAAGDSVFVSVPEAQKRVQKGSDIVVFDPGEFGAFLSQFSNGLPREFRIEGRILVNPLDVYDPSPSGIGSVGRNSSLSGSAEMEVPLFMGIVSGSYGDTVALGDTTADGHRDYSVDKKTINNVQSASVTIEVTNAMPVQVGVALRLLDISKQSLLRVPQSGENMMVNAAGVDGGGNAVLPARSTVTFELSQSEVRQYNPAEYLAVTLSMVTTPGSPAVRFRTTDSVEVRARSVLRYRFNP